MDSEVLNLKFLSVAVTHVGQIIDVIGVGSQLARGTLLFALGSSHSFLVDGAFFNSSNIACNVFPFFGAFYLSK